MRDLSELVNTEDPGIEKMREWTRGAANQCILLPPSADREHALLQTQVTTRSTMGAIAYERGGVIVDGGWLRFLGSGHPSLTRTLPAWNQGRSSGFYLVADDAVGAFFAINGGAFGEDARNMYYWAADSLDWEPSKIGFTDFFVWALSDRLAQFYGSLRDRSPRAIVRRFQSEAYDMKVDSLRQLNQGNPSASPPSLEKARGCGLV